MAQEGQQKIDESCLHCAPSALEPVYILHTIGGQLVSAYLQEGFHVMCESWQALEAAVVKLPEGEETFLLFDMTAKLYEL